MSYPVPWHNRMGYGLTLGAVPHPAWDMSFAGVEYPPGTNCIKIGLPGKLILSTRKGLREVQFS